MSTVRLTGDHLYGKLLFTWLSLVMSWIVSFCVCAVLFSHDDEIWVLISQFLRVFTPTLTLADRPYQRRTVGGMKDPL